MRNQALIACNVLWGLRAHEMLDVRMGDILTIAPDGSWTYKEAFSMSGPRSKGGKPRPPWHPKPYPVDHVPGLYVYQVRRAEENRSARRPEVRNLYILPEHASISDALD